MKFFSKFTTANITLAFLIVNFIGLGINLGVMNYNFELSHTTANEVKKLTQEIHSIDQQTDNNITKVRQFLLTFNIKVDKLLNRTGH